MDQTTSLTLLIGAAILIAIVVTLILWSRKSGPGTVRWWLKSRLGEAGAEASTKETPKPRRPEQTQIDTVRGKQEMPADSGGKQHQERTEDSSQKMT